MYSYNLLSSMHPQCICYSHDASINQNTLNYPGYPLRRGSRGNQVLYIQARLGVYPRRGNFGPKTEAAVRRFQREHGLKNTGVVDKVTWNRMFHPSAPQHPGTERRRRDQRPGQYPRQRPQRQPHYQPHGQWEYHLINDTDFHVFAHLEPIRERSPIKLLKGATTSFDVPEGTRIFYLYLPTPNQLLKVDTTQYPPGRTYVVSQFEPTSI